MTYSVVNVSCVRGPYARVCLRLMARSTTVLGDVLSPQEQRFCDAYLSGMTAQASAISAGYSERSAAPTATLILKRPKIQSYISQRQAIQAQKSESLRDEVMQELKRMAFANIQDLIVIDENGLPQVDFSKATREQLASVTSIKTKRREIYNNKGEHVATEHDAGFNLADKYRGLELLGKVDGMFAPTETKVTVDIADRLLQARARTAKLLSAEKISDDDE